MIEVNDLVVELGDQKVLKGLSLSVATGTVLGLVGPNGAGKTTLLRTIDGFLDPTAGTVRIDGNRIETLDASDLGQRVGVVPQESTIGFDFDVETLVEMGRYPHRGRFGTPTEADQRAIETALERTETTALRNRPITTLSGGQQQRVFIARALAQDPSVLLLDEPTASLDINHQTAILSLVRSIAADDRTVILAMHDLDLAARFCDRIALLENGTVRARGRPQDVLTADRLKQVFGVGVAVEPHPATGHPSVTPQPEDN